LSSQSSGTIGTVNLLRYAPEYRASPKAVTGKRQEKNFKLTKDLKKKKKPPPPPQTDQTTDTTRKSTTHVLEIRTPLTPSMEKTVHLLHGFK